MITIDRFTIHNIKSLLKLKVIDDKLSHLKSRMADGPRILNKRKNESQETADAVKRKKDAEAGLEYMEYQECAS